MVNHFSRVTIFTRFFGSTLFAFVWWFYACSSPLYFFQAFWHGDLIVILSESCTWQGDPLGRTLFAFVHLRTLCPIIIAHITCVFLSLVDDTHIIGPTSDCGFCFLMIVTRVFSIGVFNVADEMCSLIITWVGPLYIILSCFFNFWFEFSYFGCTSGIQIIRWIVYGYDFSWRCWDDI